MPAQQAASTPSLSKSPPLPPAAVIRGIDPVPWSLAAITAGVVTVVSAGAAVVGACVQGPAAVEYWQRLQNPSKAVRRGNVEMSADELKKLVHRKELLERMTDIIKAKHFRGSFYCIEGPTSVGKTTLQRMACAAASNEYRQQGKPVGIMFFKLSSEGRKVSKTADGSVSEEAVLGRFVKLLAEGLNFTLQSKGPEDAVDEVLDALGKAGTEFNRENGRPLVAVFDGMDYLEKGNSALAGEIVDRMKTWADEECVMGVFVASSGGFPMLIRERGGGAKARTKFEVIEGMDEDEAGELLKLQGVMATSEEVKAEAIRLGADRIHLVKSWATLPSVDAVRAEAWTEVESLLTKANLSDDQVLADEDYRCIYNVLVGLANARLTGPTARRDFRSALGRNREQLERRLVEADLVLVDEGSVRIASLAVEEYVKAGRLREPLVVKQRKSVGPWPFAKPLT